MLISTEKETIIHFHISEVAAVAHHFVGDECKIVGLDGNLFRASLDGEGFECSCEELLNLADWWIDEWNVRDDVSIPASFIRYPLITQLAKRYQKPICILDLETTGFCKRPIRGIVDFAYIRVDPDGKFSEYSTLLDPGIPIESRASEVHGIYAKDVKGKPKFEAILPLLKALYAECIIAGYNSRSFDVSVLAENFNHYSGEFLKPEYQLDVRDIWQGVNGNRSGKLTDIAKLFKVGIGPAHRAEGDVFTTTNLLEAMTNEYGIDQLINKKFLHQNETTVYLEEGKQKQATITKTSPKVKNNATPRTRAEYPDLGNHQSLQEKRDGLKEFPSAILGEPPKFKSQCERLISNYINGLSFGPLTLDPVINWLFSSHPRYLEKLENGIIDSFEKRKCYSSFVLIAHIKQENKIRKIDFSYKKPIANFYNSKEESRFSKLYKALRKSIQPDMRNWAFDNKESKKENDVVDHEYPYTFKYIVHSFLEENSIKIEDVPFIEGKGCDGYGILLKDLEFENSFINFHSCMRVYRWLDAKLNMSYNCNEPSC